ncbi:hypothetical protein [Rhodococcus wratislaviensis]|uniref:hypothetical protein n=1 Tax=Rhodococcus wratislaviensis TaxID=44752 RepID=UPI0036671F3B
MVKQETVKTPLVETSTVDGRVLAIALAAQFGLFAAYYVIYEPRVAPTRLRAGATT